MEWHICSLPLPSPPTVPNPHEDSISFSDVTTTTVHTIRPGQEVIVKTGLVIVSSYWTLSTASTTA